ncbi:MAG: hypothetical protein AAF151_12085 [Cyanobacteria bacterium J06656_5]
MSEILTAASLAPEFYSNLMADAFVSKTLHLGIIPTGTNLSPTLHETDRAAVIAAEYNAAGWTRPAVIIPSAGSYSSATKIHSAPQVEFTITGPTGGLTFEQYFVIYDGSITTPRDTAGILYSLFTASSAVSVAESATFNLSVDMSLEVVSA